MQIVLVNVAPDGNRGACALTWASLDLVFAAFPSASVAIVPIAVTPPEADPFRHTLRRYPNVTILPPLFDGEGKRPLALLIRLAGKIGEVIRFGRERTNGNPTLEWIRNSDLAVSVGGVVFETLGKTLAEDARLLIRLLPLLAAQKIGISSVMVGAPSIRGSGVFCAAGFSQEQRPCFREIASPRARFKNILRTARSRSCPIAHSRSISLHRGTRSSSPGGASIRMQRRSLSSSRPSCGPMSGAKTTSLFSSPCRDGSSMQAWPLRSSLCGSLTKIASSASIWRGS